MEKNKSVPARETALTQAQRHELNFQHQVNPANPLLPIIRDLRAALAAKDAEIARLEGDIEHGRCCDDYTRLPGCGHPRCVVSEVCEICAEIGVRLSTVEDERDAARAEIAELKKGKK